MEEIPTQSVYFMFMQHNVFGASWTGRHSTEHGSWAKFNSSKVNMTKIRCPQTTLPVRWQVPPTSRSQPPMLSTATGPLLGYQTAGGSVSLEETGSGTISQHPWTSIQFVLSQTTMIRPMFLPRYWSKLDRRRLDLFKQNGWALIMNERLIWDLIIQVSTVPGQLVYFRFNNPSIGVL